jgi:integrase
MAYGNFHYRRLFLVIPSTPPPLDLFLPPTPPLAPARRPAPPSLEHLRALVLDSVNSLESKQAYKKAIADFLNWYSTEAAGTGFTRAAVQAYRAHLIEKNLAPSTINVRLSALRRLAGEAADNGLLDSELASSIGRVKGMKAQGVRTGNWLTLDQAERLIRLPDSNTLKGRRDRALLGVLIGCGLRRDETIRLTLEHIEPREGRPVICDLAGKGGRLRTIPIPGWLKAAIDEWAAAAGFDAGRIFRPVNKGDRLSGPSMTAQSVFEIVKSYTSRIGLTGIGPHDLRRSFAKLAYGGRAALDQIQLSLGHASIETTQRYLGVRQDLTHAPCDSIGWGLKPASNGDRKTEFRPVSVAL